jgi:hypothetical protein
VAVAAASKGHQVAVLVATNLIMEQMREKYVPNGGYVLGECS